MTNPVDALRNGARRTFRSLEVRNYRLFYAGQAVSLSGTWMQAVAQGWLVLSVTGSGVALGTTVALQFIPVLVAGPWAGLMADRLDKRRALIVVQSFGGVLASALAVMAAFGVDSLFPIYVVVFLSGCVWAADIPIRQAFVLELVGEERVTNAVSLNSALMNLSRVAGPAAAGVLISTVGLPLCFTANAVSFLGVVAALWRMDPEVLERQPPVAREKGQLRAGFAYAMRRPELRTPLLMMAVVGTLAYNFQVVLPLLAEFVFGRGATGFAALMSAMGGGAIVGGLVTANRKRPSRIALSLASILFGVFIIGLAVAPTLELAMATSVLMGAASATFIALSNATLQVNSDPEMRGRVMSLFAVAFIGSTPVGGPIVGWVGEHFGARASLAVGAAAALAAGVYGLAARYPVSEAGVGREKAGDVGDTAQLGGGRESDGSADPPKASEALDSSGPTPDSSPPAGDGRSNRDHAA